LAFPEECVPTYQYVCTECGGQVEAVQKFSDDPLTVHDACGGRLRKVFSPVGIVFKGSGFYRTDSRNGSSAAASASASSSSKDSANDSPVKDSANGSKSDGASSSSSGEKSSSGGEKSSPGGEKSSPAGSSGGSSGEKVA
jgi:putative FmdB family regulatory protein